MEIIYSVSKTFTLRDKAVTVIGYVTEADDQNYVTTILTIKSKHSDVRSYAYDNAAEAIERTDLLVRWETNMIERLQSLSTEDE